MSTINLADLTPAQLNILAAQFAAAQNAEKLAAKARRSEARTWLKPRFDAFAREFGTRLMGDLGIIGQTIGGTINVTDPTTGEPRAARVSMSLKWVDSLPTKEKAAAEADAAEDAPATAPAVDATDATDAPATDAPAAS